MKVGLLWLEGPLQSWGHDSRFGRRATLPFPTRSGILGLLCCALGRGGEQREWLAAMRTLSQLVVAYARGKTARPPLLRDFHMVGSGYDLKDPWEDLLVPKTSGGQHPVGTGARITWRHYLQDMAFACALELPADEDIGAALAAPVWPLCLGRKCCVPSDLIWRGEYEDFDQALAAAALIAAEKKRHEIFRVLDGVEEDGEPMTLNDIPLAFGPYKEYADRQVTVLRADASEDPD